MKIVVTGDAAVINTTVTGTLSVFRAGNTGAFNAGSSEIAVNIGETTEEGRFRERLADAVDALAVGALPVEFAVEDRRGRDLKNERGGGRGSSAGAVDAAVACGAVSVGRTAVGRSRGSSDAGDAGEVRNIDAGFVLGGTELGTAKAAFVVHTESSDDGAGRGAGVCRSGRTGGGGAGVSGDGRTCGGGRLASSVDAGTVRALEIEEAAACRGERTGVV